MKYGLKKCKECTCKAFSLEWTIEVTSVNYAISVEICYLL